MEPFDDLLEQWKSTNDAMCQETTELRARIQSLQEQVAEIEAPYRDRLMSIEEDIKPRALTWAQTYESDGVRVLYRSGYERISYDSKGTDAVWSTLKDILPNTAEALGAARKVSYVAPSVSVKAV